MTTDLEMVQKKDYYGIWCRYEALFMSFYKKLLANKVYAFEDFSDFHRSCYEVVVSAVDSIKLERIKKPQTWTIYIQLYNYMRNYTSRKVIKEYYAENTLSFDETFEGHYEDDHSIFEKAEALKQIIPKLSERERTLLTKYIESGGKRSQAREAVLKKIRKLSGL